MEAELSNPSENAGCGCAYPDYVIDDVVVNSNLIMDKMKECSKDFPEINMKLGLLSKFKKIKIGKLNILILHGDVESIAGWKLSIDSMPDIGRQSEILSNWFESTGVDVFSCSHTCTPFIQNFNKNIVINNGTAGMPNFKNSQFGVITRISRCKSFITPLYGTSVDDVFIDAIPVEWGAEWNSWFEKQWPKGSPAWNAYIERIKNGTEFKVIGSGMVIVFDGQKLGHNNEKILKEGTPMTMTNLTVHVLSNSDCYNIETRKVSVLPMDAPFV